MHLVCWRRLRSGKGQFSHTWSYLSLGTAALTFTYATAYTWLAFGSPDRAEWSEMLAYVALVGWPVVWILPGWATLYAFKVQRRRVEGHEI